MNDMVARVAAVIVVLVAARLIALALSRWLRPRHPDVVVGPEGDRPGVVLFSSTECATCKNAIARLQATGVPYREITYDLEPHRLEAWGVAAVPLIVVLDASGHTTDVIAGVPSSRRLRRALSSAGVRQG